MNEDYLEIFDDIIESSPISETTSKLKEGERRNVSTLFGDIKGFVNISEKVDSEDLKNLMDSFFKVMSQLVEKYGGYVDKYSGDQIMALFGAKVASEIDIQRALVCALEIQKSIKKMNLYLKKNSKFKDLDISIRIGVCSGVVTTGKIGKERDGDFTVYGDSVNLASRLEQLAKPGTIYTNKDTLKMVKDFFIYKDLGEINIKGKDCPERIFIIEQIREQGKIEKKYKTPYIGREKELNSINEIYDKYKINSAPIGPKYIGIKAEAGIGKTRFIKEFLNKIYKNKFSSNYCISGYASNISNQPYQIFISLIKDYASISHLDDELSIKNKLRKLYDDLGKLLDYEISLNFESSLPIISFLLGVKVDDPRLKDKGKSLQTHIQISLNLFIKAIANKSNLSGLPLIIIVEDLHWVDSLSKSVITYISQDSNFADLDKKKKDDMIFIFSYRSSFDFNNTFKSIQVNEIILEAFNHKQSKLLINKYLQKNDIQAEKIDELLTKSEGNPFFIEQYLKLYTNASESFRDSEIPDNLNSLILSQIDKLGYNLKLILQKASVLGEKFYRLILEIIENKLDSKISVNEIISELENSDLIYPDISVQDLYYFKHILTRDVAYNTILKSNKKILHKLSAEIIEQNFQHSIENFYYDLAIHYDIAGDPEKTLKYLNLSSNRAKDLFDNTQAIKFYNRMLDLIDPKDLKQVIRIKLKISEIYNLIGEWERCYEVLANILNVAEKHKMSFELIEINSALGEILYLKGENSQARKILSSQMPLLNKHPNTALYYKVKGLLASIDIDEGNLDQALDSFNQKLDYFRETDSKLDIAIVFGKIGEIYFRKGDLEEAYKNFNLQFELCNEFESKNQASRALGNMGIIHSIRKEYSQSKKIFESLVDIYKDIGDMKAIAQTYGNIGISHKELSEFDRALHYYKIQLNISKQMGDRAGEAIAEANIGVAFWKKSDFVTGLEHLKKALNINKKVNVNNAIIAQCNIAELSIDMGDYDEAQTYLTLTKNLNEKIEDQYINAFTEFNQGRLFFEKEEYDKAIKSFNHASKAYLSIGHNSKCARIFLLMSNCYFELKNIEKAKEFCNGALASDEVKGTGIEREANMYSLLYDYLALNDKRILRKIENKIDKDASILLQAKTYYLLSKINKKKYYINQTLKLLDKIYANKPINYYSRIINDLKNQSV